MRKRASRIAIVLGLVSAALACCVLLLDPHGLAMQVSAWRARIAGGTVIWPRKMAQGKFRGDIDITAGDLAIGDLLQAIADWSDRLVWSRSR